MTAHWINVTEGKWKMKAASGAHTGENLGRYAVGLLNHVGIMDKNSSKACLLIVSPNQSNIIGQLDTATLDNTGNNNTTCKTIEDIHICRGLEWNSDEHQLPYLFFTLTFLKFITHDFLSHWLFGSCNQPRKC